MGIRSAIFNEIMQKNKDINANIPQCYVYTYSGKERI